MNSEPRAQFSILFFFLRCSSLRELMSGSTYQKNGFGVLTRDGYSDRCVGLA